jgi:hypothetical protein
MYDDAGDETTTTSPQLVTTAMCEAARSASISAKVHQIGLASVLKVLVILAVLGGTFSSTLSSLALDSTTYRLADDIDSPGTWGSNLVVDPVTGQLLMFTDFDDLHTFNVFFDEMITGAGEGAGAIDALAVVWIAEPTNAKNGESPGVLPQWSSALRTRNWQASGFTGGTLRGDDADGLWRQLIIDDEEFAVPQRIDNRLGFAYGVGTIALDGLRQIYGRGSILGDTVWATGTQNQIIGPKTGVVWQRRLGKWTLDSQALTILGANASRISNRGVIGIERLPGALNRPLYARQTSYTEDSSHVNLSPAGELRAALNYELSKSVTFRAVWSTLVVGNVLNATDELPDAENLNLRFRVDASGYALHQLFCGIQYLR